MAKPNARAKCCGAHRWRVCDQCGYCDGCGDAHFWSATVLTGGPAPHHDYGCGTSLERVSASLAALHYKGPEVPVYESDRHCVVGYASATSCRAAEAARDR